VRSSTFADNGLGLYVAGSLTPGSTLDHLVFGGNAVDVFAPPATAIDHSCFQGMSWPGTGNLSTTNPLLIRPFFKLAPTSPCVDAGTAAVSLPPTDYEGDPRASVSVLAGAALPDLGADEFVFAGSARTYGTGGFGLFNVFPRISSPSPNAPIGQTVQIDLTGAIQPSGVPASLALLSFGWRDDSGPLPFDLAAFGLSGSYLWNEYSAAFPLQVVSATGTASRSHGVPLQTRLIGISMTYQWFALMPQPFPIVSSDGLRVTLGQ